MDYLKLTNEELNVNEISKLVNSPKCGAISLFCGTTRDNFDGKQVLELEYECYEAMAMKTMKEICTEIRQKWSSVEHIAIYHRLGIVPVQDSSVIIAISSPHRNEALSATQFCIDTLKSRVSIWKKEKYVGSEAVWKENKECPWSNEVKSVPTVNDKLVQIKASNAEINKRIQRFMELKRETNNMTNILDFCSSNTDTLHEPDNSCARVDAVLVTRKDSKSHLKIHRVNNLNGPQTSNSSNSLSRLNSSSNNALEERFVNIEEHLLMNTPIAPDVYERLQNIEKRILQLESISPEYCQFWKGVPEHYLPPVQTVLSSLET